MSEIGMMKTADLRKAMGIHPATFYDLLKKHNVNPIPLSSKKQGKLLCPTEVRTLLQARGLKYPTKTKVISVLMCKGGVGKTTCTFFLSLRLANYGAKVLMIDCDAQGNLTESCVKTGALSPMDEDTPVLRDIFNKQCSVQDSIIEIDKGLDLIPSTPINATLESVLRDNFRNPGTPFHEYFSDIKSNYDFIFLDCAPALNLTNTVMMVGSDLVMIPFAPDHYAKMGLEQTLTEVENTKKDFKGWHPDVKIVFTKYDAREFSSHTCLSYLAENHPELYYKTVLRTSTKFKNAIAEGSNLFLANSPAKDDFDLLAQEILGIVDIAKKQKH